MKMTAKMHGLPALRMALLAVCTAALGTAPILAQDAPPPPPQHGHMGEGRGGQERQLEHMTKALNLTPDQVSQVKAIQADGRQQMMALHNDTTVAGPDKQSRMMSIHETETGKIRGVLNDDQKTKFDAMQEKRREHREHHEGGQQPPPPPPPAQ